jgi:oligoendopeptidase F
VLTEALGILEGHLALHSEQISSLDLSMVTKEELNAKQNIISDLETIRSGAALGATALQKHQDISHLASKEELQNLQNEVIANEEVHAAALNDLNDRLGKLAENVQGETVTKTEFETAISGLSNTVLENEEITATALTDLNSQIKEIITRLNNAGL